MSQAVWLLLTLGVAAFAAASLTARVRAWALSRSLLDHPNARSLHAVPTPRGGGLAIAVVVLAMTPLLHAAGLLETAWLWPTWGASLAYALLGLRDDMSSLPALTRLAAQIAIAAAWLALMLPVPVGSLQGALLGATLLVAIVWGVNLYNFMDGSDGLAATQGVLAGALGGALSLAAGERAFAVTALLLAAASAGFLRWNWHPARIFLGDAGSYFLGGQFALLTVAAGIETDGVWRWLILLSPFCVDASATLLRRMLRGERWYTAHRSHAYQRLVQRGWSHRKLALALAGLVGTLCLPLAIASLRWPETGPACLLFAYLVLVTIWGVIVYGDPGNSEAFRA